MTTPRTTGLRHGNRRGAPAAIGSFLILLMIVLPRIAAQELLVEPEEITAQLVPLEAVLEGLPPLPEPVLASEDWEPSEVEFAESGAIPEPPMIVDPAVESVPIEGDQLFFTAGLGAASVQSVLGDIGLYRITDDTRFELSYEHRSADGFAFNDPGGGFFVQQNRLGADLSMEIGERSSGGIEAHYLDLRRGLQELSPNYSVENRRVDATVRFDHALDERSTLRFVGFFSHDRRLLTDLRSEAFGVASPPTVERDRDEMFSRVTPELGFRIEWPRFALDTGVRYDARVNEAEGFPTVSRVEGSLALEGVLAAGLTLRATGTGAYRLDDGVYFPVEGSLEYRGAEQWSLTLAGGVRYTEASPVELWDRYRTLGVPAEEEPPGMQQRLFARVGLEVALLPERLALTGETIWSDRRDHLVVGAFDLTEGYYPVGYADQEELDFVAGATLTFTPWLLLDLGWTSRTQDRPVGVAANDASLALRLERERLGATLSATAPVDGEIATPRIDVESVFTLTENLELELFARDLLAPTFEDGRGLGGAEPTVEDPFIQEGLEIGALLRISY